MHFSSPQIRSPNSLLFLVCLMSLSLPDVHRIAELAQIELSDNEASDMVEHLNRLFTLIENIQIIDTDTIDPLAHPLELIQAAHHQNISALPLRADIVTENVERECYQTLSSSAENGLYLVPKVLE